MLHPHNVFLVGPMGVGKTTIGRILAKKLHFNFVDLDEKIEESCGADIAWVFDVEGEQGFREREAIMLDTFTAKQGVVLATGGGAILKQENRTLLSARGTVVYLQASVDQLYERTKHDKKRPLLQVGNPKEKICALLEMRDSLYREVADIIIPTERQSPQAVANFLEKEIDNYLG